MQIFNTLTRQKEEFVPQVPGEYRIYVCGICALAALMSRTCACSISDPMALTKASKLLFSILLSFLFIVVCFESHKGKPNNRHFMKLADCFYSWLNLFIAFALMSSAMSI